MSGNSKSRNFHGSSIVRSHLYIWAVCMVAPRKRLIKDDLGNSICDRYQELRQTVKGKDALVRILFKVTRLLYRELAKEILS